jgi:hypothetical protein
LSAVALELAAVDAQDGAALERQHIMPMRREGPAPMAQAPWALHSLPWSLSAARDSLLPEPRGFDAGAAIWSASMARQAHGLIAAMAVFGGNPHAVSDDGRQTIAPPHRPEPIWVTPALM